MLQKAKKSLDIASRTNALRIFVVARAALIARSAGKVGEARALARGVAADGRRADGTAVARSAIGIAVVAGHALVASAAAVALLAQANAVCLVADAGFCSARVAVAICKSRMKKITPILMKRTDLTEDVFVCL